MFSQWFRCRRHTVPIRSARDGSRAVHTLFCRPGLELLEDRITPVSIAWTGAGDGVHWDNAGNWSPAQVPGASDDVTMNTAANIRLVNDDAHSVTVGACRHPVRRHAGGNQRCDPEQRRAARGNADGSTSATLVFDGTQTLGGSGNLLFGGSSGNAVSIPAGQTLTVAAGITVDGQSGMFGTSAISYNSSGGSIINQGTIAADDAGQPTGRRRGR